MKNLKSNEVINLISQKVQLKRELRSFKQNGEARKAEIVSHKINQIEDFIGHPIETMTYKTNNLIVKYPSYRNEVEK